MGLTDEEAKALKELQRKAKEPDAPQTARSMNISVDLGDPEQVERARKLGLPGFDALGSDDDDGDGDGDDDDADTPPQRRGFFAGEEKS